MVPSRILGSWRVRHARPRPCKRDVNFLSKNVASLRQNFCVERKSGMNRITGTPPSGITAAGSSSSVTYDSSIFLSFVKEFLNHDPISTLLIWTTEQPTGKAPQCSPHHFRNHCLASDAIGFCALFSRQFSRRTSSCSFPGFLLPSRRRARIPWLRCTSASSRHWLAILGCRVTLLDIGAACLPILKRSSTKSRCA